MTDLLIYADLVVLIGAVLGAIAFLFTVIFTSRAKNITTSQRLLTMAAAALLAIHSKNETSTAVLLLRLPVDLFCAYWFTKTVRDLYRPAKPANIQES